jgi:hypothetical protein
MSIKINKTKFIEALRTLIKKEIEEVSTSAATPGYMTPMAFDGGRKKDKKKRDDIANQSGLKQVSEVKFAVAVDMGPLGRGHVLVDASSKGQAKTQVAKKLKQGMKGILNVSRLQPTLGKQVDKKVENLKEVTKKEVDALQKLENSLEKLQKDYWNIAKIGDKTLKDRQFNKYYETILKATKEISTLRQILKGHIRNESINEGRYHEWRNDESLTPKQKIGYSIREVRNSLNELNKTINMNLRLKTELNVDSRSYWKNTHKALNSISERLVKLASKVGNLK